MSKSQKQRDSKKNLTGYDNHSLSKKQQQEQQQQWQQQQWQQQNLQQQQWQQWQQHQQQQWQTQQQQPQQQQQQANPQKLQKQKQQKQNKKPRSESSDFDEIPLRKSADLQEGLVLQVTSEPHQDTPFVISEPPQDTPLTEEHLDEVWKPWFEGYVFSGCYNCRGSCIAICCCRSEDPAIPVSVLLNYLQNEGDGIQKGSQKSLPSEFPLGLPIAGDVENDRIWNDITNMVNRGDIDRDGWITYEEFRDIVFPAAMSPAQRDPHAGGHRAHAFLAHFVTHVTPKWYHSRYTQCKPPPLFLITVAVVCIIVFVIYAIIEGQATRCACSSPLVYSPQFRYEVWRWVSYSFMHGSWDHLVINLIMMLLLGIPLEIVHKWQRIAIIYTLGVIGGSLAHSMVDTTYGLVGASGGVYALLCAHIANVAINFHEMIYNWIRITVLSLYIVMDLGLTIYYRFVRQQLKPTEVLVSHGAHLGGGITGALVGLAILYNIKQRVYEKIMWKIGLAVWCVLVVGAILFNVFYKGFPEQNYDKYRDPCTFNTNIECRFGNQGNEG